MVKVLEEGGCYVSSLGIVQQGPDGGLDEHVPKWGATGCIFLVPLLTNPKKGTQKVVRPEGGKVFGGLSSCGGVKAGFRIRRSAGEKWRSS